jgi:hypothetical protein
MSNEKTSSHYPETERFLEWYRAAQKKGLLDLKFCARNVDGATVESFFTEFNAARNAETVKHPSFF